MLKEKEGAMEVQGAAIERLAPRRPLVAIFGRPNVGKSTLFNRLLKSRQAITDNHPGITRDRLYAELEWNNRRFTLVDTGGFVLHSDDGLTTAVRMQAEQALEEADITMLVCDASTGLTDLDRQLAALLRCASRPCLLVVNKADRVESDQALDEFFGLGLGEPFPVSAATGRRSGDLLDILVESFQPEQDREPQREDVAIRTVLVGRPNVGKSTLINRLAGYQVSIVQADPGTTRDATSIRLRWQEQDFLLIDTAGLRRRAQVDDKVEFYSNRRTVDNIARADVAIVLIDAQEGIVVQDARIMGQIISQGCGLLLAVNKWDLVESHENRRREFAAALEARFPFLTDYPKVFISALTGKGVQKCLESVSRIEQWRRLRISTAQLNALLKDSTRSNSPGSARQGLNLLYATQASVSPPSFVIFAGHPESIDSTYQRFIEKRLREAFGFEGTPIRIIWRKRRRT
jgi:GTPase